jgi:hypothetical protein
VYGAGAFAGKTTLEELQAVPVADAMAVTQQVYNGAPFQFMGAVPPNQRKSSSPHCPPDSSLPPDLRNPNTPEGGNG